MMTRRNFLHATFVTALAASLHAGDRRPRRLVLRSSWQTVNIGDIGHTPGVLRLLEEYLPGVEVRLWPSKVDNGVEEMLRARFPKVAIIKGAEAVKAAFDECDFLLHGSGASLVAAARAEECEVFVTGEMKHHEMLDALHGGMSLILAGHTNTERGYLPRLARTLEKSLPGVKTLISQSDRSPRVPV